MGLDVYAQPEAARGPDELHGDPGGVRGRGVVIQQLDVDEVDAKIPLRPKPGERLRHGAAVEAAHQLQAQAVGATFDFRGDVGAHAFEAGGLDRLQFAGHGPFALRRRPADHGPGGRAHDQPRGG